MRSKYGIRVLLAIGVAAVLAGAAGTLAGGSAAAPSASQLDGVKFKVRYQGSFDATWHDSSPVVLPDTQHPFRCGGGDSSGTLTSSVHSNSKPFVFKLGHEPGSSGLSHAFRPPNGMEKAMVTSNRTAQGFFMRYSGHQCIREDIPQPGCGTHTFRGDVAPINSSSGRMDSINPVYHVFLDCDWSRRRRSAERRRLLPGGLQLRLAGRRPSREAALPLRTTEAATLQADDRPGEDLRPEHHARRRDLLDRPCT